jgi:hypothetical protein
MATITVKQAGGGDFTTIADALASIGTTAGAGADDIVEVYNGTYLEGILNTLPSGTSWAHPFRLSVATANVATIKNNGERNINLYEPTSLAFYSIIRGFIFDGTDLSNDQIALSAADSSPSSVAIEECEFINTTWNSAIYIGSFATDIRVTDCEIHGGTFTASGGELLAGHGIYLTGNGCFIQDNIIHDVQGYGVHEYSQHIPAPGNNLIQGNTVYDCVLGRHVGSGIFTTGQGTRVRLNIVYNILGEDLDGGVGIGANGTAEEIYNNTVYGNSWIGLDAQGSTNAIFKNNIAYLNGQNTDFTGANGNGVPTNLTQSNNLIGINPLFTNAGSADFTLTSASPAINFGVNVGLPFSGSAPDAGALEFTLPTNPNRAAIHAGSTLLIGGRFGMR